MMDTSFDPEDTCKPLVDVRDTCRVDIRLRFSDLMHRGIWASDVAKAVMERVHYDCGLVYSEKNSSEIVISFVSRQIGGRTLKPSRRGEFVTADNLVEMSGRYSAVMNVVVYSYDNKYLEDYVYVTPKV